MVQSGQWHELFYIGVISEKHLHLTCVVLYVLAKERVCFAILIWQMFICRIGETSFYKKNICLHAYQHVCLSSKANKDPTSLMQSYFCLSLHSSKKTLCLKKKNAVKGCSQPLMWITPYLKIAPIISCVADDGRNVILKWHISFLCIR